MSRGMTSAAATAAQQETVQRTVAIKLDCDSGPVLVNGSTQNLTIAGEEYIGIGGLGSISAAEEGADTRSYAMTVALAGIPPDSIALALNEAYQNRPATIREVLLDATTHLPIADPVIIFRGRMDQMNIDHGETSTVSVGLQSRLAIWERPKIRRFTNTDQQLLHPGDRGFEFVTDSTEKEIRWPAAGFFQRSA